MGVSTVSFYFKHFGVLCESDDNSVISDEIEITNVKNQLLKTTYFIIDFQNMSSRNKLATTVHL